MSLADGDVESNTWRQRLARIMGLERRVDLRSRIEVLEVVQACITRSRQPEADSLSGGALNNVSSCP